MANMLALKALNTLETTIGPKKLGQIFIEMGHLSMANLNYALEYQRKRGGRLGKILVTLGYISRLELYKGLAKHFSLPFIADTANIRMEIDINTATVLTREEMVRYQVVPFQYKGKNLTILTAEPDSEPAMELLKQRFGIKKVSQIVVTDFEIKSLSGDIYGENPSGLSSGRLAAGQNATRNIIKKSPAIRILNVPDNVSELVIIKRGKKNL